MITSTEIKKWIKYYLSIHDCKEVLHKLRIKENLLNLIEIIMIYYFFGGLHLVFFDACELSLVAASGGYSSLQCMGFSLRWLLLLQSTGSRRGLQ